MAWSKDEIKLIVKDYFEMLLLELSRQNYNKSAHRASLIPFLNERSKGSVEFKHQNISAALINMGLPFIKGYKPRFNFQQTLVEEIKHFINENQIFLEKEFERFSNDVITTQPYSNFDFRNFLNEEDIISQVKEDEPTYMAMKINYLEKEQNNRSLGSAGEELVIEYEKWRLTMAGKESFADKVEWIAKDKGDGTGFDILSKNNNGSDRYIEVKTTKLSKETPIFLTKTELSFATLKESNFYLYRVFNFASAPQFFMKHGKYESFCQLQPQTFKGYF
ncbi:MAG TPA: DUF3883 domain-containing protein [Niabella sp.]|nr:DUF3883 domain-containing protein [Niabella sp.]